MPAQTCWDISPSSQSWVFLKLRYLLECSNCCCKAVADIRLEVLLVVGVEFVKLAELAILAEREIEQVAVVQHSNVEIGAALRLPRLKEDIRCCKDKMRPTLKKKK